MQPLFIDSFSIIPSSLHIHSSRSWHSSLPSLSILFRFSLRLSTAAPTSMATYTLTGTSFSTRLAFNSTAGLKSSLLSSYGMRRNVSFSLQSRSVCRRVSCAANPQTVEKVCTIVKKQLALPDDSNVTGESTFAALGADSLDTVEIVMGLEEEFGISVEEDSAQSITTVQQAADLIEDIISKQSP